MKVPIMYKSSDLYDAGTDVIYDDDSKLQYAPFVYATTKSGDGGDGGNGDGDDVEGEEFMRVIFDGEKLDKTYKEITDALSAGKFVFVYNYSDVSGDSHLVWFVNNAYKSEGEDYTVSCIGGSDSITFTSATEDGTLVVDLGGA